MTADVTGNLGGLKDEPGGYPNKFNALHHLSINIGKKLNIGVYEAVIFSYDSTHNFRLDYLNPIIFYRAIEQQNGSTDNVLLGMDLNGMQPGKFHSTGRYYWTNLSSTISPTVMGGGQINLPFREGQNMLMLLDYLILICKEK